MCTRLNKKSLKRYDIIVMDTKLARYITALISQDIDRKRPVGTMCLSSGECVAMENAFVNGDFDKIIAYLDKKFEIINRDRT